MDFQLGVRERLVADERQFDFGIGQKDQVLAGIVDATKPLIGGSRLLDAKSRFRQGRPVDSLERERPKPVVASL